VLAIAEVSARNGHRMQAGPRATTAVLSALFSAMSGDVVAAAQTLEQVDVRDLRSTDRGGLFPAIYGAIRRWSSLPHLSCGEPASDRWLAPRVPVEAVAGALYHVDAFSAPFFVFAMAQSVCVGDHPVRSSRLVATELAEALRLFGFEAEVLEMTRHVVDEATWDEMDAGRSGPCFVVWSESFGRLVDPTAMCTPALRPFIENDVVVAGPIIFSPGSLKVLEHPTATLRPPFGFQYQLVRRSCEVVPYDSANVLLIAVLAMVVIGINKERGPAVLECHPHLAAIVQPR
jgi:hypothetical protein